VDGQQVVKLGATTVQNLDDWLAGTGKTTQQEQQSEKIETAIEAVEATGKEDHAQGFVVDVAGTEETAPQENQTIGDEGSDNGMHVEAPAQEAQTIGGEVTGDVDLIEEPLPLGNEEQVSPGDPISTLKQAVTGWAASGSDKPAILRMALVPSPA